MEKTYDVRVLWCYMALDGYTERKSTAEITDKERTYKIPDGIVFTVNCLEV